MKREIITTADGSTTIHLVDWNEHYHSIHGAIQEANHVYIKQGLLFFMETNPDTTELAILEIGFGTGLNAFMTLLESEEHHLSIDYVGVEAFPITEEELKSLNYATQLDPSKSNQFQSLHSVPWEFKQPMDSKFSLLKRKQLFDQINDQEQFDLIYFDAFGARVQPELWTEGIFLKMYNSLKPNGILVTYAAKGSVRRAMLEVGFKVEKLPGPQGKREMLRAIKIMS